MNVLGISAFYHDSAAALVRDGAIIAAAQEERFSRIRHDPAFPEKAVAYCLQAGGISVRDVDYFVFYDKPFLKFERLLETYLAYAPRGFRSFAKAMPVWSSEKIFQRDILCDALARNLPDLDIEQKLIFTEHHQSHAASAFYPSPFERAAVLTMDGVGEWTTTSVGFGDGKALNIHREIHFPHSLGLLYSAFTYYLGFRVNSGEYKVMGLAPYGEPKYAKLMRDHLIDIRDDGSFCLDLSYFDYCTDLRMTNEKFDALMGAPPRQPDEWLTQRHMDIAASVQAVTEEAVSRLVEHAVKSFGVRDLCLAGGVALNCVANGKVARSGNVDRLWIQPAAGDAGGALGAALAAYHLYLDQPRRPQNGIDGMTGSYLGPEFSQAEIEARLHAAGARYEVLDDDRIIDATVDALVDQNAIGWFQGRMEFGPRALGARSILGDPRAADMQKRLNVKVKYRESFRPFAPAVCYEDAHKWFELNEPSPYMLLVADVAQTQRIAMTEEQQALFGIDKLNIPRSTVPAVTHVDYSARVQTVHPETNPRFHRLLARFRERTGCPVLVNTSFNVRGEPIVCTPDEAFRCFMGTDLDNLAIGNCFLRKQDQLSTLRLDYEHAFEPD
ncbi:MAG: carbamoyltransferase, partial [Alphaproteobacteria bacterium]|nr:carbamoyltransferase [Alphaproteobacteria bacterium]